MLKLIYIGLIIITIFISSITTIKIENKSNHQLLIHKEEKISNYEPDQIGIISIKKINLSKPLFKVDSDKNNVDKSITILKESILPPQESSITFIAAHSGSGPLAYFNDLDKLEKDDEVILTINHKNYHYLVKDIWESKKNGYINVNKDLKNQLILTTCSKKNNYQLIINCIEKESS